MSTKILVFLDTHDTIESRTKVLSVVQKYILLPDLTTAGFMTLVVSFRDFSDFGGGGAEKQTPVYIQLNLGYSLTTQSCTEK